MKGQKKEKRRNRELLQRSPGPDSDAGNGSTCTCRLMYGLTAYLFLRGIARDCRLQ